MKDFKSAYIIRIVPKAEIAVGLTDEECEGFLDDFDAPCDVVVLHAQQDQDELWEERELSRESFNSGYEASKQLADTIRGKLAVEEAKEQS